MRPSILTALSSLALLSGCSSPKPDHPSTSSVSASTGLILRESEGERRMRRPRPSVPRALGGFIIKVDEKNGGSGDLWMGYEDIPPGRGIRPHHHPYSGEILFIQKGTGRASLGSREAAVGPGSTIYIPRDTRVSLRNTGTEPLALAFIFAQPGIGEYFRETSVLEGASAAPISEEEIGAIRGRHREHITFDSIAGANEAGLILQEAEGEHRIRRPPPTGVSTLRSPYIIKVDGKNGGSPDLFMGYEDIAPQAGIAPHRHPFANEIVFVHRGSGVASVGSHEAPVTAGSTIYIPKNTRASLRNTGREKMTIAFIFPRPDIAEYFRATSVAEGETAKPFTAEEFSAIRAQHKEHITFEDP